MDAACRYALTGVGAAIAPGSQKWNGINADLVSAPTSSSATATATAGPAGGAATISLIRKVPAAAPTISIPTSMASPPNVVTSNACSPAWRLAALAGSCPMSR